MLCGIVQSARELLQKPAKFYVVFMKKIISLPNILSFIRLPLAILTVLYYNSILKYFFFIAAVFSDWLDGFFARKLKQESKIGAIFDPVFDKVYVLIVFLFIFITAKLPFYYIVFFFLRDIYTTIGSAAAYVTGFHRKLSVKARFSGKVGRVIQYFVLLFMLSGLWGLTHISMYVLFVASIWSIIDYSIYFRKTLRKSKT